MSEDRVAVPASDIPAGVDESPDMLFLPEVAERLRRSVDAVRWLINTKQLKAAKLGGRMVVRSTDLEAFIGDAFGQVAP
ncbi:helix-turn-helix domain-containing protein [Microbacterium hominis]|nr:helix-turn-helix domain-containing protein [Microbacterium hominis]QOC30369.1 helix-turn-helix domain-containing protein [Microbacterium hominis]